MVELFERSHVQGVIRRTLPELAQDDLAVRLFAHMARIAAAAEDLLVDALDREESLYGDLDSEDRCTPHPYRDHPDLPSEVPDPPPLDIPRMTEIGQAGPRPRLPSG
ncbi:hypothetical protein, partial [Streptomyces sp. NPDC127112]|uniref:hypothetical protein n=1 Tax=Streptomyces sp. NPDC127112 TaxID=3345364 RepID=UPI003644E745